MDSAARPADDQQTQLEQRIRAELTAWAATIHPDPGALARIRAATRGPASTSPLTGPELPQQENTQ